MDDRFLNELRRDPDPRFARELRERLRSRERAEGGSRRHVARWVAVAGTLAIVTALFTVPSVRVSAEALLDLFRVRHFAAVKFNESRFEALRSMGEQHEMLVLERAETLRDPGPARPVPSREAASPQVGFSVGAPGFLPEGLTADSIFVTGEGAMRLTVSESKLRALLDRLDLREVKVPEGLDGRAIEVRKPPMVVQKFRSSKRRVALVQSRSPEVSVPAGWDVERLAEIGLRILGLDAGEARRIARSTDWRSTLLVPVPMNASTFRQVTIHGQPGLLVTTTGSPAGDGRLHRVLLWTEGDRVFCIQGDLSDQNMVQMAESVS